MRRGPLVIVLAAVLTLVALLTVLVPSASLAQDTPSTGVPAPDIVPRPNSGHAPTEAGDRGGALQFLVLGLVIAAVGGALVHLTRQSRRARSSPS